MSNEPKPLPPEEVKRTIIEQNSVADKLKSYSAYDLLVALNWTSTIDIKQHVDSNKHLRNYWENLAKANKALELFSGMDLISVIELSRKFKQH